MKTCNTCNIEKEYSEFGKDKYIKDGYKNRCKSCEKEIRDKKQGRSGRKNINNEKDAKEWLSQNFPKYKILKWGGKEKTYFLDTERDIQFEYNFSRFKNKVKKNPDRIFGATKEEVTKKIRKTFKERYGKTSALQVEKFKKKQQETTKKRYGVENVFSSDEIKQKIKKTNIEKYGVDNPQQNEEIKEKTKKTMMENYGVFHPYQDEEIKSKMQKSLIQNFGFSVPSKDPKFKEKNLKSKVRNGTIKLYDEKTVKDLHEKSEFSYAHFCVLVKRHGYEAALSMDPSKTSIESVVENILKEFGQTFTHNRKLEGSSYRPDFIIEDKKLIIECDGLYWHSDQIIEDNSYHVKKKKKYEELGYNSLFFREDEILNKEQVVKSIIQNSLNLNKKIYARKCSIEELGKKEARRIFESHHLMGEGSGRTYALTFQGIPQALIQVRWIDRDSRFLDISRFCTLNGISVIGGWSCLISHVKKCEDPAKIRTFIDKRYGTGSYLKSLGWSIESNYPSFRWTNGFESFHRMKFKGNSGYEKGLVKIWDCGQAKWEKCVEK